jgi:molecular chaperone GrpE
VTVSEPNTPEAPDRPQGQADGPAAPAEEVAALRAKADQYLDLARRTQAEFENYQRRSQRIREEDRQRVLENVMRDMLRVLDNLQRALDGAKQAGATGPLVEGVGITQASFLDVLRRYNVKPMEALGKPFDPNLHEAITQVQVPGQPANTVVQVVEQGFTIDDRVLRPAKVVVSAP